MLMKHGSDLPKSYQFKALRHICSVGEPLNPEAIVWGRDVFDQEIYDTWWQTETGSIHITNRIGLPVRQRCVLVGDVARSPDGRLGGACACGVGERPHLAVACPLSSSPSLDGRMVQEVKLHCRAIP